VGAVGGGPSSDESVTNFLRRLPWIALLVLAGWLLMRPILDSAVSGAAQVLIRAYEHPRVTRLVVGDHRAELRRADLRAGSAVPTVALTEIHVNTAILLALFLSLDRPLSRHGLEGLAMAWSILFLCQTVNLVIHAKFLTATAFGPWSLDRYGDLSREIYGYLQVMTDLPIRFAAPFALWIGFNWQEVSQMTRTETPDS
jgi:hypothetical protein